MKTLNDRIDATLEYIGVLFEVIWINTVAGLDAIGDWLAGRL